MSKLTPMILALLMLASTSLVALDWTELEEIKMSDADGRSGPNAEVIDIINPRPTTTDSNTGEVRGTQKAGDDITFEVMIQNSGDSAIDEMSVTVAVYLSEGGNRGAEVHSWTNNDVICDDTNACPWSELEGNNTYLANGYYTPTYQGAPIVWTPVTGDYIVVIEVDAGGDADPGNDYKEVFVTVTDWSDIVVDLEWNSGKEVESGSMQKAATLTVSTDGSSAWEARSIVVQLDIQGLLTNATNDDGDDIMGISQVGDLGTSTMVETFAHEEDIDNVTNATRYVMNFEDSTTYNIYVTPDTGATSGAYSIEASLVSYVVYGQLPDCAETEVRETQGGENATDEERTYYHSCEVTFETDDVASTSEDEIEGYIQTFHDIAVTDIMINQGYASTEDGPVGSPSMAGLTEGPLNPDWGSVQVAVQHMGSDLGVVYDWNVTFTIEDMVTGSVYTEDADSCSGGNGEDYIHAGLGMDINSPGVMEVGYACVFFNFVPGMYSIEAEVSMINIPDGDGDGLDDYEDMSARNDKMGLEDISSLNNRPTVTLTLESEGDIIIGGEEFIILSATAVDADDPLGTSLYYSWQHPMDAVGDLSPCNGLGPEFAVCQLIPDTSMWASNQMYSVTVTDAHEGSSTAYQTVMVWNHATATHNADSGIEMVYDLVYNSNNDYTVSIVDDSGSYSKDLAQWGYSGVYDSVWAFTFTPSTTYLGGDFLSQSFTITYDTAIITEDVTSVFYVNNGAWTQLDATMTSSGSSGTVSVAFAEGTVSTLQPGTIVFMGGELVEIAAPVAHPMGLTMAASSGGNIDYSWTYMGATVQDVDSLRMTVCADDGSNCVVTNGNTSMTSAQLNGQTQTTHGVTYTVTLEVCNVAGCNPTVATGSATADKQVDGDASATEVTLANKDDNTWTVSWTASGNTDDVAGWWVCYSRVSWTAPGDMPLDNCGDAGTAASLDISKPSVGGKYFFAVAPYDALGNYKGAAVATDATIVGSQSVDPCIENPELEECASIGDETEGDGEVPTWTWGVIVGLVVVAFVVGAFILSRGGDDDEGKDWDY